ncbi:MAG: patatin-like phospholipase family protein, partial [Bacteroidetes bacterium]|nr:patatin-like phospholipase family protein [Bacteroidota bacterium]
MASQKSGPIQVPDFLQKAGINEILTDLHSYFSKQPLVVSDVKDEKGNQYVDLVQEGGGVLGVALVGYTYVLEKMGIRFFSLAGTSAGSINAMLLASCGNKEDEKMEKVIDHLLKLD